MGYPPVPGNSLALPQAAPVVAVLTKVKTFNGFYPATVAENFQAGVHARLPTDTPRLQLKNQKPSRRVLLGIPAQQHPLPLSVSLPTPENFPPTNLQYKTLEASRGLNGV